MEQSILNKIYLKWSYCCGLVQSTVEKTEAPLVSIYFARKMRNGCSDFFLNMQSYMKIQYMRQKNKICTILTSSIVLKYLF